MDLFPPTTTSRLPARSRRWARLGGAWLEASIEYSTTKSDLFDLALSLRAADGPVIQPALSERWTALSLDPSHPRYAASVLAGSEILRIANALAAGEQRAAGRPDRGGPERKQRRGTPTRKQVAGAFALLALLVPGIALVPAVARADGGVGGGGVTTPTVPIRTTPTTTTAPPPVPPPVTTTVDTTTAPTTTEPPPTTTTTATTTTAPTTTAPPPAPKPKPKPGGSGGGSGSTGTGSGTSKPPTKKTPPKKSSGGQSSSSASKKKSGGSSTSSVPAVGAAPGAPTLSMPTLLPDPTPPSMRLRPGFAENLAAAAARSHVDWALMLGVIRAQGARGAAPATGGTLYALASRLRAAGANSSPASAARSVLGAKPDATARAVALSNYYNAVGLTALVRGLDWAKPGLQQKILDDPRVSVYPGGRNDIATGRVNVRVLATVEYLAQTFHQVTISCLITGHRLYARPGVISAHVYGLAVDVAAVDNVNIIGHQGRGSITEKAIRSILMLPPEVQANQVISLMALGGPSFALPDHWNHIHIGFSPIPYSAGLGEHDGFAVPTGASKNLLQLWQSAGQTYGVPWQVLAAINKIESNFGQNMGPSSAGAIGWMQFEPSTWARYGMDASGDGKADPYNAADAIYSAARYLSAAGASTDLPRAIYAYNHAQWYVDQVLQLASLFGNSSSSGLAFAGMGLPQFTLAAATPAAPERPNSLPDTALGHGAVVEEDVAAPSSVGHGVVVDDAASAPNLPPESVVQQAKLEAGFSILRTLIGGAATPTASDKLASTTVSLPSTAPTLAAEPDGAFSLHAGYQLQTRAQQTAGLSTLGSLLGF